MKKEVYGSILKKVRLKSGLSQEELAEEIYLSRSAVSRLENNRLKLTVDDAVRWGQATQATEIIAALLCGIDVAVVSELVTTLIGGFINLFGGWL